MDELKATQLSPDGRIRRGQLTRQAILDSATYCFAERGYHDVGIREIAERAGIDKATVIGHFGGKEKLFIACIDAGTIPGDKVNTGALLAQRIVDIKAPDSEYAMLLAILRSAGVEQTNDLIRESFEEHTLREFIKSNFDKDATELPGAFIASVTLGFLLTRNVMQLHLYRDIDDRTLTDWLGRILEPLLNDVSASGGAEVASVQSSSQ